MKLLPRKGDVPSLRSETVAIRKSKPYHRTSEQHFENVLISSRSLLKIWWRLHEIYCDDYLSFFFWWQYTRLITVYVSPSAVILTFTEVILRNVVTLVISICDVSDVLCWHFKLYSCNPKYKLHALPHIHEQQVKGSNIRVSILLRTFRNLRSHSCPRVSVLWLQAMRFSILLTWPHEWSIY